MPTKKKAARRRVRKAAAIDEIVPRKYSARELLDLAGQLATMVAPVLKTQRCCLSSMVENALDYSEDVEDE